MAGGGPTPAFMLAQVFAADSAGVAAHVRERARAECVACSQWLLLSARLRSLRAKPDEVGAGLRVVLARPGLLGGPF
jgi:hypothetical protein